MSRAPVDVAPRGRVAGAPISWGVCEVPGWGHQLSPERVLTELRDVGLTATELGPDGFLPADPATRTSTLAGHGLRAIGAFVPVVLHEGRLDPLPVVDRAVDGLRAIGADVLVLAAATGHDGYGARPPLDASGWTTLLKNLDRLTAHVAARGLRATLHPHIGTMVERSDEVLRVLAGSSVPLCLDTGHLLVGGTDPVALAREATGRVAHVHLKDVDAGLAGRVRDGTISYAEAVRTNLYRPLGHGEVDVPALVGALETAGYDGWYVLEQDVMLTGEPAPGAGPVADVRASLQFLTGVLGRVGAR